MLMPGALHAQTGDTVILDFDQTICSQSSACITFDSVTEDGRCPVEIGIDQCGWEGHAIIQMVLEADTRTDTFSLSTYGVYNVDTVLNGYFVKVLLLDPRTSVSGPIAQEDYSLTLAFGKVDVTSSRPAVKMESSGGLLTLTPNPFTRNLNIILNSRVPGSAVSTVEIYDIQGRFVKALRQSRLHKNRRYALTAPLSKDPESGSHFFTWDGSHEPPGIYVIRVSGQDTEICRRATLVK
jgi:hypothetical protein